jgi:acetyl-CoA carboxylase carboxyltransferase component
MSARRTGERGEMTGIPSDWQPLLADLERRRAAAAAMGGPDKLARYTAAGRPDPRLRIDMLLDAGTFTEIGRLAGDPATPADAFVAGHGTIDGRPVLVGSEDFTVAGGSIGVAAASKRTRIATLALHERVPLVMLLEGAGHRPTNHLVPQRPAPGDLQAIADLAGLVPTVAVVVGPSAGHGALAAPLSDFAVMVEPEGALFSAGPPLVQAATGEQVTKAELGGSLVHTRVAPVAHNVAATDADAAALVRRYLSYFGSNAWQHAPFVDRGDVGPRELTSILDLIPADHRRGYDMLPVLGLLADADSVLVVQPAHGRSIITALVSIGGRSVAVVANQPRELAGAIDVAAANKAARFIQIAGAFHLPVLFLADNPGVLAGSASERAGILRAGARMFAAQRRLTVPKIHVTVRKAFGFGSSVMGMNPYDRQTLNLAFPGSTLGGIPAAVGGATSKADQQTRKALLDREAAGPWPLAGSATYDDVIDPRQLRTAILDGLRLAADRLQGQAEPVRHTGYLP